MPPIKWKCPTCTKEVELRWPRQKEGDQCVECQLKSKVWIKEVPWDEVAPLPSKQPIGEL